MSTYTTTVVDRDNAYADADKGFADRKRRLSRTACWVGSLLPFVYSNARTTSDVQEASVGLLDAIRGAGSIVAITVAVLVARPRFVRANALDVCFACFACFAAMSALWSVDPRSTLLKVIPLASMYIALRLAIASYDSACEALRGAMSLVHLLLILTALQAILAPSLALTRTSDDDVLRLGTVVPQIGANPLAYLATVGILSILLGAIPKYLQDRRWLQVLLATLYMVELLATRTRSGLLVAVAIFVALAVLLAARRPAIFVSSFLGLAGVTLGAVTYSTALVDFLRRGQSDQSLGTLTGRTEIWEVALESISQHPVVGLGFYAGHRVGLPGLQNYGTQSNLDNTWLEVMVDVGYIGTSFLALFVLVGLSRFFGAHMGWQATTLLSAVVTYGLMISLVNPTLQMPGIAFLLLVSALFILQKAYDGESSTTDQFRQS